MNGHFSKKKYIFLILISIIAIGCSSKSRTWTNPYDPDNPDFNASISGTVKNIAGEAINGVTVNTTGKTATTNSSGVYTLNNLSSPTALYTLTVSKTGYTSGSGSAYPGDTKNFTLKISGWTGTWFSGTFACNFHPVVHL